MSATPGLTDALRRQVTALEEDLRARSALPDTDTFWRDRHAQAVTAGRTGVSYLEWRDDRVTQAAVAWALVRTGMSTSSHRPWWGTSAVGSGSPPGCS